MPINHSSFFLKTFTVINISPCNKPQKSSDKPEKQHCFHKTQGFNLLSLSSLKPLFSHITDKVTDGLYIVKARRLKLDSMINPQSAYEMEWEFGVCCYKKKKRKERNPTET